MAVKSDRPADPLAKTRELGSPAGPTPGIAVVEEPPAALSLVGRTLSDRYRIERLIGEGGMGAVYQAEHTHMRKRMAIKVLHPDMSRMTEVVARFEREAMAAAHIDHPNVAAATDFGKLEDGSFFLALEYVEGKSLREVVCEGPMPVARALHVVRQIASALGRAHALGIVHRDLKPENVMLVDREGDPDFVKVLDFGIAKVPIGEVAEAGGPAQPVLTRAGMVYGTPEYMAPEQALGQPVDPRADLYALGIMAFEMLTGKRPFEDESKVKLLGMHVTAPVPSMSKIEPAVAVPPEIEAIVANLLVKEATERTGDARELIEALQSAATALLAQGKLGAEEAGKIVPAVATPIGSRPDVPTSSRPPAVGLATPLASTHVSHAGRRIDPRWIAAGAGTLVLIGLVIGGTSVIRTTKEPARTFNDPEPQVVAIAPTTRPSATVVETLPKPSIEERVQAAKRLQEKGDYASAIEKYREVDAEQPARADVNRGLFDAYLSTRRLADAMRAAKPMLEASPDLALDLAVRIPVRDAAINVSGQDKEAADLAFALLERDMGTMGYDDLYDIGFGRSGAQFPEAARRAQKILWKADARPKMTPALSVALDVQAAAGGCGVKAHLDRAVASGDGRTLALLRGIKVGPKPTGFRRDTQACLRDDVLPKAVRALEARLASEKK